MKVFMVDECYNEVVDIDDAQFVYLGKGSLDEFTDFLDNNQLSYGTLREESWHKWDEDKWQFETIYKESLTEELNKYLPADFKVGGITKANKKTNEFNLILSFDNGSTIQTNTESCTLDEIFEALRILQKPSVFGKQVKEYRIERVQ